MIRTYSDYYNRGLAAVGPGDEVLVKVKLSCGYNGDFAVYISDLGQPENQMDKMVLDRGRQVARALFPCLYTEEMEYRE